MRNRFAFEIPVSVLCCVLSAFQSAATDLKPEAAEGFDHYVQLAEHRMQDEWRRADTFLWVDRLPSERRREVEAQLREGEVVIDHAEGVSPVGTPGALIHHWVGTVFVPDASLKQTLGVVQDYDRHQDYYASEVTESRVLGHAGDDFHIFLRLRQVQVLTVVLDTEHEIHYTRLDATHVSSRSYSTRIAEVLHPGEKNERTLPPGKDDGFLWRLNSYWSFVEANGGVYVQCEAISLSRDIPIGLGFLVGPFIENVPRESLNFTLESTRLAVLRSLPARSSKQEFVPARPADAGKPLRVSEATYFTPGGDK